MDIKNTNFIQGVTLIVIVVLGIAGNITSFITWTKGKRCRKFPGTTYLRALALSDTLVLCFPGTQFAVLMTFEVELKDLSEVTCKLYDAMGHFCALVSTWLVVSLTLQRTVAVCAPLKSANWNNKRREVIVTVVLIIMFFALNLPYGLGYRMGLTSEERSPWNATDIGNHTNTTALDAVPVISNRTTETPSDPRKCLDDPTAFLHKYHVWLIDIALLFVVPFSFLIICNVILLMKIFHRHDAITSPDSLSHKRHGKDFGFASMTARVVSISVTHCILVGPVAITGLVPDFPLPTYIMLHVLFFLNHSVNFIFYSLVGTAFRRDWLEFLCCKRVTDFPTASTTDSRYIKGN